MKENKTVEIGANTKLFGRFIREKRTEKGYTMRKFCEMLDVSQTFLSRMERNEIPAPRKKNQDYGKPTGCSP